MSVQRALDQFVRADQGRLIAYLVKQLRDFQLAEDSLQDAIESALAHWARSGIPDSPVAWLMQTARRKAIDRLRRAANFRAKEADISYLIALEAEEELMEPQDIEDERLRLIFTCCHPALAKEASVALTLRTLCGLSTDEIARAFVTTAPTMAQRIVRAQKKIKQAAIAYEVPASDAFAERLEAVLDVIYLVFNAGYTVSGTRQIDLNLCHEAIRLARLLDLLQPGTPEIMGLLGLCLLQHSRAQTRFNETNEFVPLEEQDRAQWNRAMIDEGIGLVEKALSMSQPGPFQIQAAIAALHAEAPTAGGTDWAQIALLYGVLNDLRPNPVVALSRVVALSYARDVGTALLLLETLRDDLRTYQPFHAVEADLLRRAGDGAGADLAYQRAIDLTENSSERDFLQSRRNALMPSR